VVGARGLCPGNGLGCVPRLRRERRQAAALWTVPERVVLQPRVSGRRCKAGPLRRRLPPRRSTQGGRGGTTLAVRCQAEHHRVGRDIGIAGAHCDLMPRMRQEPGQTAALRTVPKRVVLQPRVSGRRRRAGPLRGQLPPRRRSAENPLPRQQRALIFLQLLCSVPRHWTEQSLLQWTEQC